MRGQTAAAAAAARRSSGSGCGSSGCRKGLVVMMGSSWLEILLLVGRGRSVLRGCGVIGGGGDWSHRPPTLHSQILLVEKCVPRIGAGETSELTHFRGLGRGGEAHPDVLSRLVAARIEYVPHPSRKTDDRRLRRGDRSSDVVCGEGAELDERCRGGDRSGAIRPQQQPPKSAFRFRRGLFLSRIQVNSAWGLELFMALR